MGKILNVILGIATEILYTLFIILLALILTEIILYLRCL